MPITAYLVQNILNHMLRNQAFTPPATLYFTLHDGDPSDGSTNEMTVDRVAGSFAAPSGSNKYTDLASTVSITDCPTGTVVGWSVWDAATSGNCLCTGWLSAAPKAFSGAVDDLISCPAHGFSEDDQVVFYDDGLGTLPTGISEATVYYVIATDLATDGFKVSATQGGSAVNITASGQGYVAKLTPKTIANAGDTFNLTSAQIGIF